MRLLAAIVLFAVLGCASLPVRPDRALFATCGSYSVAAMRAADLVRAGAIPRDALLELRSLDRRMNDACNAGAALAEAGQNPEAARALVVTALAEFERVLLERAGAPGSNAIETGVPSLDIPPAP